MKCTFTFHMHIKESSAKGPTPPGKSHVTVLSFVASGGGTEKK